MPLVERYCDWKISDGSLDDPHTFEFDHRIEADAAKLETGLSNVEDNVKAICVITILKPEFGWTQVGNTWSYDPSHKETDLNAIWRNNISDCVQHDKDSLKECFCNANTNPMTAYVGPEAEELPAKLDSLEWPNDTTEFISRFASASQYVIGPLYASAYHLGNGYVGTAGHCLEKPLTNNKLGDFRMVFNWTGDVASKRTFSDSEVFEIERVVLCDTHGETPSPVDLEATSRWTRRWDAAVLKLKGASAQFSHLKTTTFARKPPAFGNRVYNVGSPLGTQLKVSTKAHLLRHSLVGDGENPFSHQISCYGTFSTDLDQFEGNSGGPVFDAKTGFVVGHTSSTQDAVSESDTGAIESWAEEFAKSSRNYALCAEINEILEKQEPNNKLYRVRPKFLRTLQGKPRDSPLIRHAMNVCPGDLGPNRRLQVPGRYQAVLSRHRFDSKDLYLRNVTARVDRSAVFMTPPNVLLNHYDGCFLIIALTGKAEAFRKPDGSSTLIVSIGPAVWKLRDLNFYKDTSPGNQLHVWTATIDLTARGADVPQSCQEVQRGLIEWTNVRLEQPFRNPPLMVGLNLSVRQASFPFAVNKSWPPRRSDVTNSPADVDLHWPEETFEFATTAGETSATRQTGGFAETAKEGNNGPKLWTWEAPLDRVWTNPRQPSQGLRDPLMDDIDQLLS